jgi:hypothetical protein
MVAPISHHHHGLAFFDWCFAYVCRGSEPEWLLGLVLEAVEIFLIGDGGRIGDGTVLREGIIRFVSTSSLLEIRGFQSSAGRSVGSSSSSPEASGVRLQVL